MIYQPLMPIVLIAIAVWIILGIALADRIGDRVLTRKRMIEVGFVALIIVGMASIAACDCEIPAMFLFFWSPVVVIGWARNLRAGKDRSKGLKRWWHGISLFILIIGGLWVRMPWTAGEEEFFRWERGLDDFYFFYLGILEFIAILGLILIWSDDLIARRKGDDNDDRVGRQNGQGT